MSTSMPKRFISYTTLWQEVRGEVRGRKGVRVRERKGGRGEGEGGVRVREG